MKSINRPVIVSLFSALLGILAIAFVLSYLYPVIGGSATSQYFQITLHSGEAWRLIFAVFLVSAAATALVFVSVSLFVFLPVFSIFPRIVGSNVYIYLLLGVGASLLVLAINWLAFRPMLTTGDYIFSSVGIIIDGPVATLIMWFVGKRMRAEGS